MTTRWLLTYHAIDPNNLGGSWEVGVPENLYRKLQNNGHEKAMGRLFVVGDVLQGGTLQLRKGWSRPGKEDCFVYLGLPTRDFKSLTIRTPAPKGMVFLVFVGSDGTISAGAYPLALSLAGNSIDPSVAILNCWAGFFVCGTAAFALAIGTVLFEACIGR